MKTVKILDWAAGEVVPILLDGCGAGLAAGMPPVWLEFREGELQVNSRGEPFVPQATFADEPSVVEAVPCS